MGNIFACNEHAACVIARSEHFEGDLEVVDFGSITAMYGGLHYSSQVLVRNRNVVSRPNPFPRAVP